jgi:hypothetical protein
MAAPISFEQWRLDQDQRLAKLQHDTITLKNNLDNATEKAAFFFVFGQIDSTMKAQALSLVEMANITNNYDYNDLLDHLKIWTRPNKREIHDHVRNLRMGSNESFAIYLSRFEQALRAAGITWSDDLKILQLRRGLQPSIESKLAVQLVLPENYPDFVQACHKLSKWGDSTSGDGLGGYGHHGARQGISNYDEISAISEVSNEKMQKLQDECPDQPISNMGSHLPKPDGDEESQEDDCGSECLFDE